MTTTIQMDLTLLALEFQVIISPLQTLPLGIAQRKAPTLVDQAVTPQLQWHRLRHQTVASRPAFPQVQTPHLAQLHTAAKHADHTLSMVHQSSLVASVAAPQKINSNAWLCDFQEI